jgi:hypothetical protein
LIEFHAKFLLPDNSSSYYMFSLTSVAEEWEELLTLHPRNKKAKQQTNSGP